jgi:hypothetical protein
VRVYTARSIGQSSVTRLGKESTVRALKRDPLFAALFVAYLLSRVVRVEEDLVDQFFNFSEKRLVRVLLLFGQIIKDSQPEHPLKVSQATLAEMTASPSFRFPGNLWSNCPHMYRGLWQYFTARKKGSAYNRYSLPDVRLAEPLRGRSLNLARANRVLIRIETADRSQQN